MKQIVNRWVVILGVVLGLLLAPALQWAVEATLKFYDALHPVASVQVQVVGSDAQSVVLRLTLEKRRACELLSFVAFTEDGFGVRRDASLRRIDVDRAPLTRDVGVHDVGLWEVRPAGRMVILESTHQCHGRLVRSRLAEVLVDA